MEINSENSVADQEVAAGPKMRSPLMGPFALGVLAVLLAVVGVCWIFAARTDDSMSNLSFLHLKGVADPRGPSQTLVDQTPWQTARALAPLAVTQEELAYARQAQHLADHEVDQAFASALRQANLRQRTLTGEALALQQRVGVLEGLVASDTEAVKAATPRDGDDLEIAKAQLVLDQDQLNEARDDLARASGDRRADIQQELAAHELEMKKYDADGGLGEAAVTSAQRFRTLAGLIGAWKRQSSRYSSVLEARAEAERAAKSLEAEHNRLDAEAKAAAETKASQGDAAAGPAQGAAGHIAQLKHMSLQRQLLSIYDDRIETERQLAQVYDKWAAQILVQHRILKHLIALQVMDIAVILIVAILLGALVGRLAARESLDQRRLRTLGRIARLVLQVLAFVGVLLVIFGRPANTSTVIGLTTAGLTVALQDFILAFVGWFILMGRSGVGVGDVVEINGVAGEVVDIGVFRTTLLETGNWTAKGHPTGRRVAFNNKFAISGQYFNFSTTGQWMWDQLTVTVPADEDAHAVMQRVMKATAEVTAQDSKQAEVEWRKAARTHGLSHFSAQPAVDMRPSGAALDLVVRYITRASERFERRNKLYQCVLEAVREVPGKVSVEARTEEAPAGL